MAVIKGEYTFEVRFIQMGVPFGAFTKAIIIHKCTEQIYLSSPLARPERDGRSRKFSVKLISKKVERIP